MLAAFSFLFHQYLQRSTCPPSTPPHEPTEDAVATDESDECHECEMVQEEEDAADARAPACAICLCNMSSRSRLDFGRVQPCGHTFHGDCLLKWLDHQVAESRELMRAQTEEDVAARAVTGMPARTAAEIRAHAREQVDRMQPTCATCRTPFESYQADQYRMASEDAVLRNTVHLRSTGTYDEVSNGILLRRLWQRSENKLNCYFVWMSWSPATDTPIGRQMLLPIFSTRP
jgi:hypothetical protein